jgi:outer membrane protein OmpA-like peptidoglycan-associated protein
MKIPRLLPAPSLLAAFALAGASGCAENIPPRPPPIHEAKPELPPWYPEPPWNSTDRPARTFFTGKILFDTDKSIIRADAEPVLQKLLAYLKDNPDISRLRLEGHTDARASEEYNQGLSERRALAIGDWLVDHGLDANRLLAVGFSELRPIAPNESAAGRQENRRTSFHVAEVSGIPRGGDPTNGGLVVLVLTKEERDEMAKQAEVPEPPPPAPFNPEGPVFKPEETPAAQQGAKTAPVDDKPPPDGPAPSP